MNQEILDQLKLLNTKQQEGFQSVNEKIDASAVKFTQQIDELSNNLNTRILQLEVANSNQNINIAKAQNDIDRLAISNELRIAKVPFNTNENLVEIFKKIATLIQFDISNPAHIPSLRRLPVKNRLNGDFTHTGTILVQFVASHIKSVFYGLYLNKIPIKLSDIGFEGTNNFHIGENLTKTNNQLFNSAYKLKKEKKIAQCYTSDGLVHVKINSGERPITIYTSHDLQTLITSLPTANVNTPNANDITMEIDPDEQRQNGQQQPAVAQHISVQPPNQNQT